MKMTTALPKSLQSSPFRMPQHFMLLLSAATRMIVIQRALDAATAQTVLVVYELRNLTAPHLMTPIGHGAKTTFMPIHSTLRATIVAIVVPQPLALVLGSRKPSKQRRRQRKKP